MKKLFNTLIFMLAVFPLPAQILNSGQLAENERNIIFTEKVKTDFNINLPVKTAYYYQDKSGQFYAVFCEQNSNKKSVKSFIFKKEKKGLKKIMELSDTTLFNKNSEHHEEHIGFWERYCEFQDIDKDGLIDPIMVYATNGLNGIGDGRIKILIFHKNKKIAIRHQNGILDFERNTSVDKAFYALNPALQNHIIAKMKLIEEQTDAIFPCGWEEATRQKKLYFDEH